MEQVLSSHACAGGRLGRLEFYTTASDSGPYSASVVDVTQVTMDGAASRLVTKACISRLEDVADVVFVGGEWLWELAEDERSIDDDVNGDARWGMTDEGGKGV